MTAVLRIIRFTFQNVGRNLWLTLATLAVLTLTLVSVNLLIAVNYLGGVAASAVEDRVDLAVHFRPGVEESRVRTVQSALLGLAETKDVRYVSPEEGAREFAEAYADDAEVIDALTEAGDNPFGATLVVKARELDGYQRIRTALADPAFADLIDGQNYDDGQAVVANVRHWAERATSVALAVSSAFIIITVFIVYTTVRMSINTHRDEIAIMRLVGAPDTFIRGPFYGEAVVWTAIATLTTAVLVWLTATIATPWLQRFFGTATKVDLLGFYADNAAFAMVGQVLAVLLLTLVATRVATSRYIRV
jgi:cell division transport system permease protein